MNHTASSEMPNGIESTLAIRLTVALSARLAWACSSSASSCASSTPLSITFANVGARSPATLAPFARCKARDKTTIPCRSSVESAERLGDWLSGVPFHMASESAVIKPAAALGCIDGSPSPTDARSPASTPDMALERPSVLQLPLLLSVSLVHRWRSCSSSACSHCRNPISVAVAVVIVAVVVAWPFWPLSSLSRSNRVARSQVRIASCSLIDVTRVCEASTPTVGATLGYKRSRLSSCADA